MHLVEVLEGRWQLLQHRSRVTQVHAGHVVTLEGVDEALGHAVALRAAHRRVDRLEPQRLGNAARLVRDVGPAVVGQELQFASLRYGLDRAKVNRTGFGGG